MTPVNYSERREHSKGEKLPKNVEICIEEGEKPEFYTKEHEKLLGHYKQSWTLYEDGYDEDGQRIYDPDFGKSCHQCRYMTVDSSAYLISICICFYPKQSVHKCITMTPSFLDITFPS